MINALTSTITFSKLLIQYSILFIRWYPDYFVLVLIQNFGITHLYILVIYIYIYLENFNLNFKIQKLLLQTVCICSSIIDYYWWYYLHFSKMIWVILEILETFNIHLNFERVICNLWNFVGSNSSKPRLDLESSIVSYVCRSSKWLSLRLQCRLL